MTVVPATSGILKNFYGDHRTCRAFAVLDGDEVLGVWGYYVVTNHAVVFSDLKIERKKYAKSIVKEARKLLRMIAAKKLPLYATADLCVDGSVRFLEFLGFRKVKEGVYLWER